MKNLENDNVIPGLTRDPRRDTALTPTLSQNWERGTTNRVLFLSLSGIGNLIMQLPTIKALKKAHPTWHITVWVAPRGTKEIAEVQPYIDEVIEAPVSPPYQGGAGGGVVQHLKNILALRQHHFDIGIVLSPGQLIKSALYLKLAGIPIRIGNSYPYKNNSTSSKFLTHPVDEKEHLHDIEQNLKLLEPLGIHAEKVLYYFLQIPQKNIQQANEAIEALPAGRQVTATAYVGIHAGCAKGFEFKQWPLERFAEVAKALIQNNPNTKILVFGGPDEEEQKQELAKMINSNVIPAHEPESKSTWIPGQARDDSAVAHVVSTSLLTTAAIMQYCKLMISNDSGLMHLAAAVGVPVIGIFGPTDEALTGPRGPKSFVVRAADTKPVYDTEKITDLGASSHKSMLAITPQIVLDKIEEMNVL